MKEIRLTLLALLFFTVSNATVYSQHHHEEEKYFPETDSLALKKIIEWQGLKFGLLMHWGTYSQWGIVESWSLCPEEYGWCERTAGENPDNYFKYKKEYENLITSFNPVDFEPEKWARAASEAGMKYVVFTTKHHDGFCMFDTKYTDYKVTSTDCPFSENPKSNITLEIFNAFREKGLWTGAYFSKPDWNMPSYWDPAFPPRDRNVNYDPDAYPEKWASFTSFTHNQILELMTDYGNLDILWLDGGWVAKQSRQDINRWYDNQLKNAENGYLKHRIINQDIKMDELVKKAREKQPGLIVVDRAVPGKNQNYLTPENRVPDSPLPYPWESCIISGGGWSHTPDANYMSGRKGIHLLVDIVAKGGNLLLNIAPGPDGKWQQGAYDLLTEYADWMKINASAIYGTKSHSPYKTGNICLTRNDAGAVYFIYLCEENETILPELISVDSYQLSENSKIRLLGYKETLQWKNSENGFVIHIPELIRSSPPCKHAWVFEMIE